MKLSPLPCDHKTVLAFAGHIGVGHVNSHQGFVQDDAAGFATLLALLLRACPLDPTVTDIRTDQDRLTVSLACGGRGRLPCPAGSRPLKRICCNGAGAFANFLRRLWPPKSWAGSAVRAWTKWGPSSSLPMPVPCWMLSAGTGPQGCSTPRTTSPAAAANSWAACFPWRGQPAPGC